MTEPPVESADPCSILLLATDGSEFSAGTERVGLELARRHQSLLYVLHLLTAEPGTENAEDEEQVAKAHLARVAGQCAELAIECKPLLRRADGDIPQAILDSAKEVRATLLVIGRRGKRGLAKLMVGDATAKILDRAEFPVLVVPRLVSYWENEILLAFEDETEDENDATAHAAFDLAQTSGLPLTILLVTEKEESGADRRDSYQSVNRLVAMAKLRDLATEGMVQSGDIDELILEVARQRSVDLIVCEPRDRSLMERLFNLNNILKLIGQAHCPVMVVK